MDNNNLNDKFKTEKIDENRINDKNLIDRILINSKKNNFDYLDSVDIVKNKNFIIIQLILIFFIFSLISIILISFGFIYAYFGILIALLYVFVIYKKFSKIENKILEEKNNVKISEIKKQINQKWYELFLIMENIPIELERIEYTRKKFELKILSCEKEEDFHKVLKEITDDIIKYKNVSGNYKFKIEEKDLSKEIINAYMELELPPGTSFEEVKKKYKNLIKKYHPDEIENSEEKTIRLNKSYNLLKRYLKDNKSKD